MRAILLVALIALAGCQAPAPEPEAPAPVLPQLHGFILDEALVPIPEASIRAPAVNASASTDEEGRYVFDGLPIEQPLVFIVEKDGFEPTSKSITLVADEHTRLNFTMVRETIQEPYFEIEETVLFLVCGASVAGPQGTSTYDCGSDDRHDDQRDFAVAPGTVGLVIEAAWTATSDAGRELRMTVETVGFGDQDQVLGEALGQSMLRIPVPQATVERYYGGGGHLRVSLEPAVDTGSAEAGTGATFVVEQEVEVFVSAFFVDGPPATYSVAG